MGFWELKLHSAHVLSYRYKIILRVLLIVLSVPIVALAQKTAAQIHEQKIDATLTVNGKEIILSKEMWKLDGNATGDFYSTVRAYTLKNAAGRTQYSQTYPEPEVRQHGFSDIFDIRPFTISTPSREALGLWQISYPSAPSTGTTLYLFTWSGDSLVALGEPLEIYGHFGDFTRKPDGKETALSDSEIILMTSHVAYYFYVDIPLIINLDPSAKEKFRTTLSKDPQSGLRVIPVTAELHPDFMDDEPAEITLYHSAKGTEFSQVSVGKETPIKIGSAYGKVKIDKTGGGVSFKIHRLKITVDGKTGFIERTDYRKVGLPAFG